MMEVKKRTMRSVELKKIQHSSLEALVLPSEDLENSLVIIRVEDAQEAEAVQDALECAEVLAKLNNASFLIVAGDVSVDVVTVGSCKIAAVRADDDFADDDDEDSL